MLVNAEFGVKAHNHLPNGAQAGSSTPLHPEGKYKNVGKGCQGTCIKDTWTKPKGGRIEGGMWGWLGWGDWWGEMETTVLEHQ